MKKLLSVFLAVALISTIIPWAVSASSDHDLENAILTAKSKIEIPEEYSEFSSNIYTDYGKTSYSLRWTTKAEEYSQNKQISINVNSYDDITGYDCSDYTTYSNKMQFAKFTDEEFKNAAKQWLFSVNPSWEKSLPDDAITVEGVKSVSSSTIPVVFKRMENGLPFCNDYATVLINTQTNKIESFYSTWTYPSSIPDPGEAIDEALAEKIYHEKSPMELSYKNIDNHGILVYTPQNGNVAIDAHTGDDFNFFRYGQSPSKAASGGSNLMPEESADASSPEAPRLTESELKNIDEVENLLTEHELHNIAENLPNTEIKDLTLISTDYHRINKTDELTQYRACLYYKNTNPDSYGSAYVYLDAQTGELFNFNCYTDRKADEKNKVSFDTALKTAESFIKQFGGQAAEKVKNTSEPPMDMEEVYNYNYYFCRFENDIPFSEDGFSITINPVTGNITSYYTSWNDEIDFETPDGLVSPEKAGEILVDAAKMVLSYDFEQGESTTEPIIGMTYRLGSTVPRIIKAKTGEIINYNGELYNPQETQIVSPKDISGHYGEAAITKLLESGLITLEDNETAFRPDDFITQRELIAFLCCLDYGAPQPIYSDIVARKINNYKNYDITIEPDSTASREFGVMLMVTALNYQKTAKLKGIYKTAFADQDEISEDMLGYVALGQGLGIIAGDGNGLFNPTEFLTRADAAIMIYNYLSK